MAECQRTRLFHKNLPDGKIFTDTDDTDAALAAGWVDSKLKINQAPPEPEKKESVRSEKPATVKRRRGRPPINKGQ